MSTRVGLRLSAQSRLVCLVHVLLHVLKAWAPLVHVASVWVRGHHSPVTLIFLPTLAPPRKPSSESYSSSIELWMTNNVSLGTNPDVFERCVGLRLYYLSPIFSDLLRVCDAEISSYQYALSLLPRSA